MLYTICRDIKFNDVRRNTFIHGHLIRVLELSVVVKCLQHCVLHSACQSVNFNKIQSQCQLLDVSFTDSKGCGIYSTAEEEWTYYGSKEVGDISLHVIYFIFVCRIFSVYAN